jgi:hypothetical protein
MTTKQILAVPPRPPPSWCSSDSPLQEIHNHSFPKQESKQLRQSSNNLPTIIRNRNIIKNTMMTSDDEEELTTTTTCSTGSCGIPKPVARGGGLCPCCNLPVHRNSSSRQVVGETKIMKSRPQDTSLFTLFSDAEGDDDEIMEDDDDDDEMEERMMPGVLAKGIPYTVKDTIARGYVHKKGSGYDWIGSRAWKARWAVLVVRIFFCLVA